MGRVDLGGFTVDLSRNGRDHGAFVDIAMIRRDGGLLQ